MNTDGDDLMRPTEIGYIADRFYLLGRVTSANAPGKLSGCLLNFCRRISFHHIDCTLARLHKYALCDSVNEAELFLAGRADAEATLPAACETHTTSPDHAIS